MILRHYDADAHLLRFHTDARAPKVKVIANDPRVAVLGYDRVVKLQLRMQGRAWTERFGAMADAAWAESRAFARRCYLGVAPGEGTDVPSSGLPSELEDIEPLEDQLLDARKNFAIMPVTVERIDWFSLAHIGHRRSIITAAAAHWVIP